MGIFQEIEAFAFTAALVFNALLFIPQALRIWRGQTAAGVSLLTFVGFWLTQLIVVIHGLMQGDVLLAAGYGLSMLGCGAVIVLTLYFRWQGSAEVPVEEISAREILQQLPGHVYWKNTQGEFLGCNDENWQELGLASLDDYTGKTDHEILPRHQADELLRIDKSVIKTGEVNVTEEEGNLYGSKPSLFLSHKKPLKNQRGDIIGCVGVSLDITDAKRVEIQRLTFFEDIVALMPGHVYWVDRAGFYLGCNDEQAQANGLTNRSEILGKRNRDLPCYRNTAALAEQLDQTNQQVMSSGQAIALEEPAIFPDGTESVYLSNKMPMKDSNGQVIGMVGVSIDVTAEKEAEIEKRKALMQCAAQVSHDIRSPLAALNTVLRVLPNIPEDQRILIRNAVGRINDIANNLLVEYRDETGVNDKANDPQSMQKQSVLLSSLLDTLLSEKKIQLGDKRIDMHLEVDSEAFCLFIEIDVSQFGRVISNLLNNAIEASTDHSEIILKLSREHDTAMIRLIDQGQGMPAALLAKLQTGSVTEGKAGGTGIGVASSRDFVNDNGGRFCIESVEGQGTTIHIDLPVVAAPDWFQQRLQFQSGNQVVILDDDQSIHAIWASRCQPLLNDITLKHIHHSKIFREYCLSADLSDTVFLVDYELLGSTETGLDVIEALGLGDKATLVTSRYEEPHVQAQAKRLGMKIIPKNFSPYIDISLATVTEAVPTVNTVAPALVFLDDDSTLTQTWQMLAELEEIDIQVFNQTADLQAVLPTLPKTTPIYVDSCLAEDVKGEDFAKTLYDQGYQELYLASGHQRSHFGALPWIKDFVGKMPPF